MKKSIIQKVLSMILAVLLIFSIIPMSGLAQSSVAFRYGDVTGDGAINAKDALEVLKAAVNKTTLNEQQTKAGDVDGNGTLDAKDALYILQYAVDIIDKFPVETMPVAFDVKVTDAAYGAKGDGKTNDRAAIQAAIDDAHAAGGGTVRLDAGKTFVSGNLLMRSNVTLFFEDGSKLLQSGNAADFVDPLNNFEPRELVFGQYVNPDIQWDAAAYYNYPLIYAGEGTQNIKITGNGTIEMNAGNDSRGMMTMQAIGLFRVDGYELSDFTVRKYYAYCIKAVSCSNGLYKNLTVDVTGGILGGTDGINLTGCRDIRVTGCNVNSGDDGIYIGSDYKDPRTGLWYNCDTLLPIQNIEIDHNHCEVAWDDTKAFCFIMWGSQYPDQSQVEVSNIYIHDNYFESIGAWTGNWNVETQKFDFNGSANPMKNIRFENNTIDRIQSSFYTLPISDVYGFDCMATMKNGDFATKDIYWVSRLQDSQASAGAQQNPDKENDWYGYIRDLDKGDAALYQGLKLQAGRNYCLKAMVQTSGDPVRLFVKDQITQELIASQEISNTQWEEVSVTFQVPADGNYHIGIERGNATKGWAYIDDVSCEVVVKDEPLDGYTIFSDEVPAGIHVGDGLRNQYGTIFSANTDGLITKVRIYTSERETGIHYVSLWNFNTKEMLTEDFYEWEIVPGYTGWQTYTLPTPVSIQANTEYVVAVSAGDDASTSVTFNNTGAFTSKYLTAPIDCCVSSKDAVNGFFEMPDDRYSNNVFRDVVFVPTSATETIFTDQVPATTHNPGPIQAAYGTVFSSDVAGTVTHVRIYTTAAETGIHHVALWDYEAKTMVSDAMYEWEIESGYTGWQVFELPKAVPIEADKQYVVAVSSGPDGTVSLTNNTTGFTNGHLSAPVNSCVSSRDHNLFLTQMPDDPYPNNVFRDVVFVPGGYTEDEEITAEDAFNRTSQSIADATLTTYGRAYYQDDALYFNWTMSGFSFEIDGTDAYANFNITKLGDRNVYVNVYVDDETEPHSTLCLTGSGEYLLARGLPEGKHTIKVLKRSEASIGTVAVRKLSSSGSFTDQAPEKSDRTIEVLGDSITAGFGNLVTNGGSGTHTSYEEDGTRTFATMAAERFGADIHTMSVSGIGCKYVGNGPSCTMQELYPYVDGLILDTPNSETKIEYDFAGNPSDVVIIALGTNDIGWPSDSELVAAAEEMIAMVREKNPDAVIIWCYGMMVTNRASLFQQAVENVKAAGDNKVYYLQLPQANAATEGTGTGGHPTLASHLNAGEVLTDFIAEVTDWDTVTDTVSGSDYFAKSALFVGDSISFGSNDTPFHYAWANRLADNMGIIATNKSEGGWALSTVRGSHAQIVNQFESVKNNTYNYVIMQGGVNDAGSGAPVGTITEGFDPTAFDTATYAGALENLFYTAKTYFPEAALGYIINYQIPALSITDMGIYYDTAIAICEKWEVPYLDLHHNDYITNELIRPDLIGGRYNMDDEIHLNHNGYDALTPYIKAWFKTLTPPETEPTPSTTETIFTDQVPATTHNPGPIQAAYGTVFSSDVAGTVTHVRIYTTAAETGVHHVALWDYEAKTMVSDAMYEWEIESGYTGWQVFELPKAVSIEADKQYVVAVSSGPDGTVSLTNNTTGFTNGHLSAPVNSCVSSRDHNLFLTQMPDDPYPNNVFRDVVFVPEEEVTEPEPEPTGEETIFTTQVPATVFNPGYGNQAAFGTVFSSDVNGTVTKVRIYTNAGETGTHHVAIWDYEAKTMVTAEMYAWDITENYEGWQTFTLPEAVSIEAGKQYVVAVSSGPDGLVSLTSGTTGFTNGHLTAPVNSCVSSRNGNTFLTEMPDDPYANNVFRDVVFIPEETIFTTQVPATVFNPGYGKQQAYGTVFSADVNGTVTKVRIYTAAGETGTHYVAIWDYKTATMVTAEMYAWNITENYEGWQTFTLPEAVSIQAGKQYVVSVSSGPDGMVSLTSGTTGFTNGHLTAPVNSCVSSKNMNTFLTEMPADPYANNVFRDVVFIPASK